MRKNDVYGIIMARLDKTRKEWDAAEISHADFDTYMALHNTLTSLVNVFHDAMIFARENGRLRIFTIIRDQLIGPDESDNALPIKFQPLGEEVHFELWEPFLDPIADGKISEWFSDLERSKPVLEKKIKKLQANLEILKTIAEWDKIKVA